VETHTALDDLFSSMLKIHTFTWYIPLKREKTIHNK